MDFMRSVLVSQLSNNNLIEYHGRNDLSMVQITQGNDYFIDQCVFSGIRGYTICLGQQNIATKSTLTVVATVFNDCKLSGGNKQGAVLAVTNFAVEPNFYLVCITGCSVDTDAGGVFYFLPRYSVSPKFQYITTFNCWSPKRPICIVGTTTNELIFSYSNITSTQATS